MKRQSIFLMILCAWVCVGGPRAAEPDSRNAVRLQEVLKRFAKADTDNGGVLTLSAAKGSGKERAAERTRPTFADVKYGPYERNVLDFYQAKSSKPTPLVVYIHGGGFKGGDKRSISQDVVKKCLESGVSVAAIHYRFLKDAILPEILRDSARAIQFLRYKAREWNVDKRRVAAYGGSAGAGTSLWLGFHDELADPDNDDPILRESSRLTAVGAFACQFTYDFRQWPEVIGENPAGSIDEKEKDDLYRRFYGFGASADMNSPKVKKVLADVDMRGLLTEDDSPVFLYCGGKNVEPTDWGHYVHHPRHAIAIKRKCDQVGVSCQMKLKSEKPSLSRKIAHELMLKFFFKHFEITD